MQHQGRSLRRRPARLEPRPRVLIICEGEVTEPSYFNGLKAEEEVRSLEVIVDNRGGVPKTLVERAAALMKASRRTANGARDQNLRYDEIWCVFDVDEHPKLLEAKEQAKANEIQIAVSNPCFELWLLLHFREQSAWIDRHDVQRICRECLKGYKKEVNFAQIRHLVEVAIQRANKLQDWQDGRGCSHENPSTTVQRLVQRLKEIGKSASLKEIQDLQAKYHQNPG